MVPSGFTFQVSLCVDGSSVSRRGDGVPSGPMEARYWLTRWLSSREPPPPPPLTPSHQFFGSSFTATTRILGAAEEPEPDDPCGRLPVEGAEEHPAPTTARSVKKLNHQRISPHLLGDMRTN